MKKKKPTIAAAPSGGRDIRTVPMSFDTWNLCWQLSFFDHDGPWGSHAFNGTKFTRALIDKVRAFESMTWGEIKRSGDSHFIPAHKLTTAAQKRLVELKYDDTDELFSLRCSGKERLWGVVDRMILRVLWWDPEHEICPSVKKHT